MSLNTQYLVLFKNPRDQQQVAVLARQMYPDKSKYFLHKFQEATSKPYGYLFIDLKQETPDDKRLKTNVIKGGDDVMQPQLTVSRQEDNTYFKMANASCIDCGTLFASPMDVQHHLRWGCPEDEEPSTKKMKFEEGSWDESADESTDESGWENLTQKAYDAHNEGILGKSQKV